MNNYEQTAREIVGAMLMNHELDGLNRVWKGEAFDWNIERIVKRVFDALVQADHNGQLRALAGIKNASQQTTQL